MRWLRNLPKGILLENDTVQVHQTQEFTLLNTALRDYMVGGQSLPEFKYFQYSPSLQLLIWAFFFNFKKKKPPSLCN